MFFLFGINYFQLKSFSFHELELPVDSQKRKYTVDLVEAYFHILQIPVFSLGKKLKLGWYGDYFPIPAEILTQIDPGKVTSRRNWYAFTGVYLLMVCMAVFLINRETNRREVLHLRKLEEKKQLAFLESPRIGDLFYFTSPNLDVQAEVHAFSNDSILFTIRDAYDLRRLIGKNGSAQERMNRLIQLNEHRNFLNDSLVTIFPNEPLLCDVLALQIIDSSYEMRQIQVGKERIFSSWCADEICTKSRQGMFSPHLKQALYLNEIVRDEKLK